MRRGAVLLTCVLLLASVAEGQQTNGRRTVLTVSGLPSTVSNIVAADFDAGFKLLGTATFTVDATANSPNFSPRVTTVTVRCFSPCPAAGTSAAAGLQWRRGDLGTWVPLTTTLALVESRSVFFDGLNDPWSNTIQFRYLLDWGTSAPTTTPSTFQVELQLAVSNP